MLKHKFSPLTCNVYIYIDGCITCTDTEYMKKEDEVIWLYLEVLIKFTNFFVKYTNCPYVGSLKD